MSDERFAPLPGDGPCWAVIFSSLRTEGDAGYADTAGRMVELAARQPGFLGVESARGPDGFGITVSYWRSPEDIAAWRAHAEHALAREAGREKWYAQYALRIARVERAAGWAHGAGAGTVPGGAGGP